LCNLFEELHILNRSLKINKINHINDQSESNILSEDIEYYVVNKIDSHNYCSVSN